MEVFRSPRSCQDWSPASCRCSRTAPRHCPAAAVLSSGSCADGTCEGPSCLSHFLSGSPPLSLAHFGNSLLCSCWEAFIRYTLCEYFLSAAFHSLRLCWSKSVSSWLSHISQYTFYGLCFWSHVLRILYQAQGPEGLLPSVVIVSHFTFQPLAHGSFSQGLGWGSSRPVAAPSLQHHVLETVSPLRSSLAPLSDMSGHFRRPRLFRDVCLPSLLSRTVQDSSCFSLLVSWSELF